MADSLRAVKTTKKVQNNIEMFESLSLNQSQGPTQSRSRSNTLNTPSARPPIIEIDSETVPAPLMTPVSTRPTSTTSSNLSARTTQTAPARPSHRRIDSTAFVQKSYLHKKEASLSDDAKEILKSQPSPDDRDAVLSYIQYGMEERHDFNIKITSPKATQLIRVLVSTTLPDLWPQLRLSKLSKHNLKIKNTLLSALFSVTGIQTIVKEIDEYSKRSSNSITAEVYYDFLATMLNPSDTVLRFLRDGKKFYQKEVYQLFWNDIVSLLAGGKILSKTALVEVQQDSQTYWLSYGPLYSSWLARNLVKASTELAELAVSDAFSDAVGWKDLGQLLDRAMTLGWRGTMIPEICKSLVLGQCALWSPLHALLKSLSQRQQKAFFHLVLDDLLHNYFNKTPPGAYPGPDVTTAKAIAGTAALINGLVMNNPYLFECAADWVGTTNNSTRGSGLRRALLAVLAQSQGNLQRVLQRALTEFSDRPTIQYSSTAQQENLTETILLLIGILHCQRPESLKEDPIPTLVMRSVSNRLASSVPRTRLLGMIVGVGMSKCVDEPEKVMDFHVEEMETEEVKELLALIDVNDTIGTLGDLREITETKITESETPPPKKRKIAPSKSPRSPKLTSKILAIEEVSSSENDEEDLVPYHKPLDDPEDSEEDPTLIDRNKPKAPIYIVDLIKQLQLSSDKLEVISLALETAASLIRRKAEFGTELADNIHSLASALINLQDGMSKPEHQKQRLDALVACLVARPAVMGKYLASTYFNGDFSLSQRSTILIAIGLGARELADVTDASKSQQSIKADIFPSERLPRQIQPTPLTSSIPKPAQHNQIADLSNAALHGIIRPLALAAAESQAGPKVLQINRMSSSLTNKNRLQERTRKIPKDLNAILSNSIYLPLSSPLTTILSYTSIHPSSAGSASLILHPSIITLHLQTLTLILHTLGPTGLSSPQIFNSITHETLLLLSTLSRTKLSFDPVVLPALLGLLLALIDITVEIGVVAQERLLGDEFGHVVAELVRWVAGLEGNGAPPPSSEDGRGGEAVAWTVLAAGIQVKWMEIGRRFQGRMLGFEADEV